jgi:hypothetical protein
MEDLDWDRTGCITAVRDRIWNYLSPASRLEGPGLLAAGALLQWPEAEASRLGELQFLLCRETGEFLSMRVRLTYAGPGAVQCHPLAGRVVAGSDHHRADLVCPKYDVI